MVSISPPLSSLAGCPYEGMRYYDISRDECAPCFGTCDEPNVPCPRICRSGCACPPGTVLHEEQCIPTEECPKKGKTHMYLFYNCHISVSATHMAICHRTLTRLPKTSHRASQTFHDHHYLPFCFIADCREGDQTYKHGDSWLCSDGCNSWSVVTIP